MKKEMENINEKIRLALNFSVLKEMVSARVYPWLEKWEDWKVKRCWIYGYSEKKNGEKVIRVKACTDN